MRNLLFAVAACCGVGTTSAAEWRMSVEKDGVTNVVTAAGNPFAVDVDFGEKDGAWSGRIVNREKGAVVLGFEVWDVPQKVMRGKSALYLPHVYGRRITNWPMPGQKLEGREWRGSWTALSDGRFELARSMRYPSKFATMQWMTLNDGECGRLAMSEDATASAKDLAGVFDPAKSEFRLGFRVPMFLPKGVSCELPRIVFSTYRGTWHVAAKRYRTWWDTVRKVVHIPDSVKDCVGFVMLILRQQNNGDICWPYTEFDAFGDMVLKYGFRHVEFHGWAAGGHDTFYPEYDPDPEMGGRDALMKGIAGLRKRGIHVSAYSNGQLQQRGGTKWWDERGFRCPVLRRDGTPLSEYWSKYVAHPVKAFDVCCPSSPDWRERMLTICRDAKDLGFQGFFYDQIGKQWPWPCFDAHHGHRAGEYVFTHDRETMMLEIIRAMQKADPDFVLWSEAFNDTILNSTALYQGLYYLRDNGYNALNRFDPKAPCGMYPEMTFYVFPELVMTDRSSTSFCSRLRANQDAVCNLRVDFEVRYQADRAYVERGVQPAKGYYDQFVSRPSEIERMTTESWARDRDYLRQVNDFRRAHGDMLLRGTFVADEGFAVSGGEKVIANRWVGANGESGILVWNADPVPRKVVVGLATGGLLISASEPERGRVEPEDAIPANSLRLYRYRVVDGKPQGN